MTSIEHDTDAGLADFMATWRRITTDDDDTAEVTRDSYARFGLTASVTLIGLTNFGEHPVQSTRWAEVLGGPVGEAEALARKRGWPRMRVEDGLITVNHERAPSAPRRHVQVGDRRFGVTGCAPDVFLYAPLVRPSVQVEEICPATATPIRLIFTPGGVESVDPPGTWAYARGDGGRAGRGDGYGQLQRRRHSVCGVPVYSSVEAAQGWVAGHPGGRVFPVREAWDVSVHREWRDRMSALLNLDEIGSSATVAESGRRR